MSRKLFRMFACALLGGVALPSEPHGVWLDVPYVAQEKNGCGAASIAMVVQYWQHAQGRPVEADAGAIHRELYSPDARGVYASAMERYFREHGFRTFAIRGEWNDLVQHLEKGRPLIVALKPGGGDLHYVVVTGFDGEGHVLKHDPAVRRLMKQDRAGFEKEWRAANNWTLLALPRASAP